MSSLVHWKSTPTFHSLFDDFFRGLETAPQTEFAVRADIRENEKEFVLSFDLPGIPKEDVKVEFDRGILSVSGERKAEPRDGSEERFFSERRFGKFSRAFRLPEAIDAAKIEADFRDGVLKVSVPKSEAARPRTINIAS